MILKDDFKKKNNNNDLDADEENYGEDGKDISAYFSAFQKMGDGGGVLRMPYIIFLIEIY